MAKCESHPLDVSVDEKSLSGRMTVRNVLITIAASCSIVAWSLSLYLIYRHVTNYTNPKQQRLIVRIVLMVPIYTIACVFSIVYYKNHVYLAAIYEFYESLVIASFFLLLCRYLNPDVQALRRAFVALNPKPWLHPVRFLRKWVWRKKTTNTRDGLKWFSIIWSAVFQFVVVKFLGALAKCITEGLHLYCKELGGAKHAKIWIQIIEILSLVTAMFCLLQFYSQCKTVLARHRPLLKFVAIKLVVFLFYVQSFILDRLTTKGGDLKPTKYISYPSLVVGIPNTLLCFEMGAIAILHLWAYPWHVYSRNDTHDVTKSRVMPWWQAILHVLNFADIFEAIVHGYKGLRTEHRRALADRGGLADNESSAGSYGTYDLAEALDLVERTRGTHC